MNMSFPILFAHIINLHPVHWFFSPWRPMISSLSPHSFARPTSVPAQQLLSSSLAELARSTAPASLPSPAQQPLALISPSTSSANPAQHVPMLFHPCPLPSPSRLLVSTNGGPGLIPFPSASSFKSFLA